MTIEYSSQKKTGAFYTPDFIVDFMVERVFNYLVESKKLKSDTFVKFKKSLLNLKFCDPSIGTGNFLVGLLKKIWKLMKSFESVDLDTKKEFLKEFVEKNIYGIELDELALDECKYKIKSRFPFLNTKFNNLRNGNSLVDLDSFDIFSKEEAMKLNPFSWDDEFGDNCSFDVIIGNPPYFNLKKMELVDENAHLLFRYLKQSENWKNTFRASTDIYYYFIVKALSFLSKNGILAYIIPDYWLDNKYADIIRRRILEHRVLEIVDLGNEKIFKDNGKWINVSTCIVLIQNSPAVGDIHVYRKISNKIIERYLSLEEDLGKFSFTVKQSSLGEEKWVLSPYLSILETMNNNTNLVKLGEISTVIQGVSPGVKDVFVLSETEIENYSIETDILVPFISNKDIKRWLVKPEEKKHAILPTKVDRIEDYPNTFNYLKKNKNRLKKGPDRRKLILSGKIKWYDFSVYRNLELFAKTETKIMCPYRSQIPRFGLDESNSFCATDVYGIVTDDNEYHSILGILNSEIIRFWYMEAGKRKGKMLEFFSDPLKKIPIPKKEIREDLEPLVQDLFKVTRSDQSSKEEEIQELEESINQNVAHMYNLEYNKIKKILS